MIMFEYYDYVWILWLCLNIMIMFEYYDYVWILWLCLNIMIMFEYIKPFYISAIIGLPSKLIILTKTDKFDWF